MEICEEIISYPFIKYATRVTHATARQSTAFEWLFLESLIQAEDTEFSEMNMDEFFRTYFKIDNPDVLMKPVLKRLYDLKAVACPSLTDDTSLSELSLDDVEVLPLGREMQQKGLLPAESSDDSLDVLFDVTQKKLDWENKKLSAEADGNYVQFDEFAFPEREVRDYIESQKPSASSENPEDEKQSEENSGSKKGKKKKKKNSKKIDWLKDNTEIESVVPTKTETLFDNISRKVHLKDGLVWKIESNKVTELEEASLENFENPVPESLANVPDTKVTKPDEEIAQVIRFEELQGRIGKYATDNNYQTVVIDSRFFDKNALAQNNQAGRKNKNKDDKKSFKIRIVSGAEKLAANSADGMLILSFPEELLASNCLLMTENFSLIAERFLVRAGDVSRSLTFAYLPKNKKPGLQEFIRSLVQKYGKELPAVLFLLNEVNGMKDEFKKYFGELVSAGTMQEKAKKIEELNSLSAELTGKKYISDEEIIALIIDKEQIQSKVTDIASAQAVIEEYAAISVVKNQVLRDLLKFVLEQMMPTDSVEEIWSFLDFIRQCSPDSVGYLDKQGLLGKLYSAQAKNSVFKKVFGSEFKNPHSDIEVRAVKLAECYRSILSQLPNVDAESPDVTIENALQSINAKKLSESLNTWKTNFENFRKWHGTVQSAESNNAFVERIKRIYSAAKNTGKTNGNGGHKK